MADTFTSGMGAPAESVTVTVRSAVAVDGAAGRGARGRGAGAGCVPVGGGWGVCAEAGPDAARASSRAVASLMAAIVLGCETVGKGGNPRRGPARVLVHGRLTLSR